MALKPTAMASTLTAVVVLLVALQARAAVHSFLPSVDAFPSSTIVTKATTAFAPEKSFSETISSDDGMVSLLEVASQRRAHTGAAIAMIKAKLRGFRERLLRMLVRRGEQHPEMSSQEVSTAERTTDDTLMSILDARLESFRKKWTSRKTQIALLEDGVNVLKAKYFMGNAALRDLKNFQQALNDEDVPLHQLASLVLKLMTSYQSVFCAGKLFKYPREVTGTKAPTPSQTAYQERAQQDLDQFRIFISKSGKAVDKYSLRWGSLANRDEDDFWFARKELAFAAKEVADMMLEELGLSQWEIPVWPEWLQLADKVGNSLKEILGGKGYAAAAHTIQLVDFEVRAMLQGLDQGVSLAEAPQLSAIVLSMRTWYNSVQPVPTPAHFAFPQWEDITRQLALLERTVEKTRAAIIHFSADRYAWRVLDAVHSQMNSNKVDCPKRRSELVVED